MLDMERAISVAADMDAPENEEYMRGIVELITCLTHDQEGMAEDFDVRREDIEASIRRQYKINEWETSKNRAAHDVDLAEWHIVHLRSGHVYDKSMLRYTRGDGSDQAWRFPEV